MSVESELKQAMSCLGRVMVEAEKEITKVEDNPDESVAEMRAIFNGIDKDINTMESVLAEAMDAIKKQR
jgi:hypothetical protein